MRKFIYTHNTFITKCFFKNILVILYCICTFKNANAQQFNNWVFPDFNGITFNTNPISLINGGQINSLAGFSAASISDRNGNLLFYSDGEKVWNKNNALMPNGFGLFGNEGQINTVLIVPFINDTSKYFLFTSKGLQVFLPNTQSLQPYCFSVIDMQLNGGLGDVTNKNTLIQYFSTQKMVAIPNSNGNDIWWVCRDWTNHFYSYKITCTGFQNNIPIISTIGNNLNNDFNLVATGDIKASPDGTLIAASYSNYFEIYKFDKITGTLSNPILISDSSYGIEFSPDSKLVYVTGARTNVNGNGQVFIKQFNLANYNTIPIISSAYTVDTISGYGGLQLGPDNKIYNNDGGEAVDVINNPNVQGIGCNFQDSVIVLPNGGYRRFPYSYVNLITAQNVQISYTVAPDCRTVTFTGKTFIKGNNLTFKWKWGEPPPVGGTIADSATQVVASQGDTTFTTITHTYPPGIDTFFVNLSVTSDTVCGTGRASIKVIVKPPKPTANFTFASTCNNLSVAFTDASLLNTNPSITHQYAVKPALAAATAYVNYSTTPNHTYTFPSYDSFDIRLIVSSPLACVAKDTIIKRVVLKAKPTAGFTYTNACGSLQANFTSTASIAAGNIATQQYYLGNTLIGTDATLAYSFASYGSYTIKHITKSNFGCLSDTASIPVVVIDKPTLTLTTIRDSVCNNSSFTITANANVVASTISNYTWLRNGIIQPITNNQLTDNQPTGTYIYKVIANAANTCKSDTVTKIITVISKPTATLTATNICGSKAINILSSANVVNDNITNYYLSYGDGSTSIINPNNTIYTYANFGSYTIKFVAKSSVGCASDTVFVPIMGKDKPTLSVAYNNDACNNKNFTLTATAAVNSSTITNYTWIKDGVILSTTSNNLIQNNVAGTNTYKVVATANTGCKSDTAAQIVTVQNFNTTLFTAAGGCVGNVITINNTSTNNNPTSSITYNWTTSDAQTSTAITPNFTFTTSGTKTIQLKTTSTNGCADSLVKTITIDDYPIADFSITEACLGKPIAITNSSIGIIANYNWTTNNGLSDNNILPNFIFNTEGNYDVKLQVATPNNCTSSITKNTSIQAVQLFTNPIVDTNAVVNQGIALNAFGASSYIWSPGINLQNPNTANPIFLTNTAGIYPLRVEGITAQGCKGTANIKVKVFVANNYVWIPNAFTPNGDGLNDKLKITCSGLWSLTSFTIYNRFGEVVYKQTSCNAKGWDGTYKSILQPQGVFVYTWAGVKFNGEIVGGKGTVMLVQ